MSCGGGGPKAGQVGLTWRCETINAPSIGSNTIVMWPDPADLIDSLGVGQPLTSSSTSGAWKFQVDVVGHWVSTRLY